MSVIDLAITMTGAAHHIATQAGFELSEQDISKLKIAIEKILINRRKYKLYPRGGAA